MNDVAVQKCFIAFRFNGIKLFHIGKTFANFRPSQFCRTNLKNTTHL